MRCGESQTQPDVMRVTCSRRGGGIALLTPCMGDVGVGKTRSRAGEDRTCSRVGIQLPGTYVGVGGALWAADAAVML